MQKTVFEKKLAPKRNLGSDKISVLLWKLYLPGGTRKRATAAKSWDPKDFKTVVRFALSIPVKFQCLFKVLFRFHFWHIWGHFRSRNFADRKSTGAQLPVKICSKFEAKEMRESTWRESNRKKSNFSSMIIGSCKLKVYSNRPQYRDSATYGRVKSQKLPWSWEDSKVWCYERLQSEFKLNQDF